MKTIFCLMGPTACGKTDLACYLSELFPLEIVSVDSAMLYRGMDIGTAKPAPDILHQFPHHLVDILNPDEIYSAAAFCRDVENLSREIFQRGKWPLLVGGTMMYFNALQKGLSALPESNPDIRLKLLNELDACGLDSMHRRLQDVDQESASRIHSHDTQRIIRALEIHEITGQTMTDLSHSKTPTMDVHFLNLALFPENRAWLHERIESRFDIMLNQGLIEEVQHLMDTWQLKPEHPSMKTVGYRQVLEFLSGEYDKEGLRERGNAATRQLAKRQLTWLRSFGNILYFDPNEPEYSKKMKIAIEEGICDNI